MSRATRLSATAAVLVLVALGTTACASAPSSDDGERVHAVVEVAAGSGAPPLSNVWIHSEFGDDELLGTVSSGQTEQFRYVPDGFMEGTYQLVLQAAGPGPGKTVVSDQFIVSRGDDVIIRWDTAAGQVSVEAIPEPDVSGQ